MITTSKDEAKRIYEKIAQEKATFGLFHKALFHVHTPASYDYHLLRKWNVKYDKKTCDEIRKLCIVKEIIPTEFDSRDIHLLNNNNKYSSEEEFLAYILLADSLLKEEIEVVVVCDHNTIEGIEKLKSAIKEVRRLHKDKYKTFCSVISGVEISCADRLHVIGIFEDNTQNNDAINTWIKEKLLTVEEGVFLTSYDVMTFFDDMHAITYMAHLNTSDIFKDGKFLSYGYRKKLLDKYSNYIGLSKIEDKVKIDSFIKRYTNIKPKYVLDNDAHDIDSLKKNIFWIKCNRICFNSIKEAFIDFDVSISYTEKNMPRQSIEGMFVEFEKEGFLKGVGETDAMCIKFSDSLNCFIGGRGTGKSTVIQLLDYALGQKCNSKETLNFLCSHGNTWVLYSFEDKQFLVELLLPYKEHFDDDILSCFKQNQERQYGYYYSFNQKEIEKITREDNVEVFEVVKIDGRIECNKIGNKKQTLNKLYDTQYSVNELVKTADSDKINDFIYDKMFANKDIAKPSDLIKCRSINGLKSLLREIDSILSKRSSDIFKVIEPFNETKKDVLKIVYSQKQIPSAPLIEKWVDTKGIEKKYNLDKGHIIEYLFMIYRKEGTFNFLNLSLKEDNTDRKKYSIIDFSNKYDERHVEKDKKRIDENNQWVVVEAIFNNLVNSSNVNLVIDYIKQYLEEVESFSLEFNINSKETATNSKYNFKNIKVLSLGQKVVAMLDFIIGYGEFSNDYRPLIIDQPEDNLDNQYIYKNLVKQLRQVKTKRQIIIATHNSTIVTNAMADNVCIMESDGYHGWVGETGYPGDGEIKKAIVNILEGGKDSFNHKIQIYDNILTDKCN